MKKQISNHVLTQVILLACLLLLGIVIIEELTYFLSGVLGAVTLYLLFRNWFFKLTEKYHWKKSLASIFFIVSCLVVVVLPLTLLINYFTPKLIGYFNNRKQIIDTFNQVKAFAAEQPILKRFDFSENTLLNWLQKLTAYVPSILNSVAEIVVNLTVAFFILFFMQVNGRTMEQKIRAFLPFSEPSKDELWHETNKMVRANAIGIPILGLCQGIVAIIGYLIFGVDNAVLWGLLTGAATIIPVVGTMVVWVPICIVVIATGNMYGALGLALYNLIVVGSTDNILRFTIMKGIGNVHPLITVFGVILGLNLFGMMGLVFGPLIISYFGVLMNIYNNEYGYRKSNLQIESIAIDQETSSNSGTTNEEEDKKETS